MTICCACSKKCSALQCPESRFGNTASTGKGTVGPVWGWWLVWELAGSRFDREESRQAGRAARERWAEITEMSWPGVEEECRRKRNDHAHEIVIVQPNGRIMLPSRARVASNSNNNTRRFGCVVCDTPHGTTAVNGLRRPTFFLPACKLRKLPKWPCKHPTTADFPAVIMLPGMA